MNEETNQPKAVDLTGKVKGKIELPSIDVKKYIGMKAKIDLIEEMEGQYGYFIKVSTEILDVLQDIKDKENQPVKVRASRIFGLSKDAEGNLGWADSTKLGAFLNKMGVEHYAELAQREVVVQTTTSTKDNKDYLTFN